MIATCRRLRRREQTVLSSNKFMKKKFFTLLVLLSFFAISSCGKKGPLEYPGEQKRPKFDQVTDEN